MKITDKTEEHDFGPNKPRPIIQTTEGFKVEKALSIELREKIAAYMFHVDHPKSQWKLTTPSYKQHQQREYYLQAAGVLWHKIKEWENETSSSL